MINKAPITKGQAFSDGPSLKDNRQAVLLDNQTEALKEWESFFGSELLEVRWDLFEDFLYLLTEFSLGKYLTLLKQTNWDKFFNHFYGALGKRCESNKEFKEIPEIPFTESGGLVYRGVTVRKQAFVSLVENNGITTTLKHFAETFMIISEEADTTIIESKIYFMQKSFLGGFICKELK